MLSKTWMLALFVVLLTPGLCRAHGAAWTEIPAAQWQGTLDAEVKALGRRAAAAIALPARDAAPLTVVTAEAQPAGLYEVRLQVRPSHVADAIAFHSGLHLTVPDQSVAMLPAHLFARPHRPETRTLQIVHPGGPLALTLDAYSDASVAEAIWTQQELARGGPQLDMIDLTAPPGGDGLDFALDTILTPNRAVYFVVDAIAVRPLSRSGRVVGVETDRIRYLPGATLKGTATVADVGGGKGGAGKVHIYLEHGVRNRVRMATLPVTFQPEPRTLAFEIQLPATELGYALVAEFVSDNGEDRSEAAEYFTIAENFQRVAIFGGGISTRDAVFDDETILRHLRQGRESYANAVEYFAWAEDDLMGMSPATDFWSSGQTNYRMHKQTMQRQIRLAQEQGIAVSTYGKWAMTGLPGWENVYRHPDAHWGTYIYYPVGKWNGVNVPLLDRRRDRDYRRYNAAPPVGGNRFDIWWSSTMWLSAPLDPRMVRMAAEECIRSIDMFGWDAIRWDDHPRGGGQVGRSGHYDAAAARRTQAMVRYFKDIVAERHPDFRHGYNYLLVEHEKTHDWAIEDFELDELARGGGLLMNESIGNASAGYTFDQIARNLQVEGDLCRERGGFYLGISYAMTPRDRLIESALWAAAGCRPYSSCMTRETRRYLTRYAQYTLDERLRRLATPEQILVPQAETDLWWQPFVYETPLANGRRQLVVNLLNIPRGDRRPNNRASPLPKPVWDMPSGTEPVDFALTLPAGVRATAVHRLDPWTLEVEAQALTDNRFTVPSVAIWNVLVIDLDVEAQAPSLASLYGPPATVGRRRAGLDDTDRRPEIVLDVDDDPASQVEKLAMLRPPWEGWRQRQQAEIEALAPDERERRLIELRPAPETLIGEWWKGFSLPADLELKERTLDFGDLAPRRNGRVDIHYGRGAMDYPLRMPQAFARFGRFRVHDAPLWGSAPNMGLANGVGWRRYPEFDLLLFTGIPHCAIGAENAYALVDYVKAGGAAFFTGGEYAFGKGGYIHTVLERELLPVKCFSMYDTMYANPPRPFEPGPDFAELGVDLDFAARPVFWVRNQIILKPQAKVFLASGDQPILVGWQLGEGRVACLLVDHRGQSGDGVTAFFDWPDWPKLAAAVIAWLTPDAARTDPPLPPVAEDAKAAVRRFAELEDDDLFDGAGAIAGRDGGAAWELPAQAMAVPRAGLAGEALQARVEVVRRALAAGNDPELADALARQLATVGTLPLDLRLRIVAFLHRTRPAAAAELGQTALGTGDSVLHGSGYVLLALAGDPAFAKTLAAPPRLAIDTEAAARVRARELALAVALYTQADLVDEGRRRIEAWNQQEEATRSAHARFVEPDHELLETSGPYLDADAVFHRFAWLIYLARHEPQTFAAPFVREWLLSGRYQDYCERSIGNFLYVNRTLPEPARRVVVDGWRDLSARLRHLRDIARPDVEALLVEAPHAVAEALAATRLAGEAHVTINLLGNADRLTTVGILERLRTANNPDLAAFAAARAETPE